MKAKRFISVVLAAAMAMSLSCVVYADGTISSLAELKSAFASAGTYTVASDFNVTNSGITASVTIDGNNHTLTSTQTNADSTIFQNENVTSTFKNLTIIGNSKTDVGIWEGAGSMTITDSTIQGYSVTSSGRRAAVSSGSSGSGKQGNLTLNNVKFVNNSEYDITVADAAAVTINAGTELEKLRLQSNTCTLNIGADWSGEFEITMDSPASVELGTVGDDADVSGITVSGSGGYYVENDNGTLRITNDNGAELYFDMNQRGLLYKGSTGFLYGVAEPNVPTIDLLQGLQPAVMVQKALGGLQHPTGDAIRVKSALDAAGAKSIQVYLQDIYLEWPYNAPYKSDGSLDVDGYTKTCEEILYGMICDKANADDAGAFLGSDGNYYTLNEEDAARYSYVLFNEPDQIWYGNNLSGLEAAWKQVYEAVHKIDPNAKCAGPNFAGYKKSSYDSFLSYCKINNCLPEIISWHELGDSSMTAFFSNYSEIEAMAQKYYLADAQPELLVNEYARHYDIATSGGLVKWLAMFEDKDMDGCLAYWGMANSLNEVAADQNSPSSTWWVYHWYAQMTGEQITLTSPSFANTRFYGLTAYDEDIPMAYVLFGGSEEKNGRETVYLENMDKTDLVGENGAVNVKVYGVGFSGQHGANYKPEVVFDGAVNVTDDTLKIQTTDTDEMDAFFAIVTPTDEIGAAMKDVKISTLSYEAEDAELIGGARAYDKVGWSTWAASGRKEVGSINNNGDGVKFTVNVPETGYYNASLFYSLQAPSVNPMTLEPDPNGQNRGIGHTLPYGMQVDDGDVKTIYLNSTISWSYRAHYDTSVRLTAGEHTVTFTHINGNEGSKAEKAQLVAAIDKLDLDLRDNDDFEIDLTEMKSFKTGENSYEVTAVAPAAGHYLVTGNGNFELTRQIVDYAPDAKTYSTVSTRDVPVSNRVYLSQGANTIGVTGDATVLNFVLEPYMPEQDPIATIYSQNIAVHGTNAYHKTGKFGTVITELGVGQNAGADDKGEDNYIELNVNVKSDGMYNIAIDYANDEPAPVMLKDNGETYVHPYNIDLVERYAQIKVNDNEPETVYFRHTMSWDTFKTVDMQAELNAGDNTIRIYNDNSYQFSSLVNSTAPEIKTISVTKLSFDGQSIKITSNGDDIDTSKLDEAIAKAEQLIESGNYTDESAAALQAVIDNVNRATQSDVNKSRNEILDAIDALKLLPSDEPILWYDFENGATDISGNNNNGTVNGAVITESAAVFDGVDDYIQMPNGILKDADSATVAIYLKPEIEKQNQFTWCIGNTSTTGYMFLNTYNPNSKLRAAITLGTYSNESELATSDYVKAGEWTSIIAVFDGENSVLYRDGKAVATANISIKPSDLGATTANYIAKSVYNDPYFKGSVSDFRIYNRALSAGEAAIVSEEQKNPSASRNLVDISDAETNGGALNWSLTATGDISDVDIYTAVYNSDGALVSIAKNQMDGTFEINPQSEYTLKVFTWKKGTMEPIGKGYAKKQIKS